MAELGEQVEEVAETTELPPDTVEAMARRRLDGRLRGKVVAILATDGFEQIELLKPREALEHAGARTVVISPKDDFVQGFHHHDKGDKVAVEQSLAGVRAESYDALLLPGGALNPDALRAIPAAVELVRRFAELGRPIAAICHGPWMLIEAGLVKGRRLTSWPSIKTDVTNAGGAWVDAAVVADRGIVTSRGPDDLPAFNQKMIETFAEGVSPG